MDRTRWDIVALLFVVGLFAAAQFGKIALTLPEIAAHYGTSETAIAWLVSVVGGVGLVFGAMAGALVARIGARPALLWALVLGGGFSLFQALLPGLALMGALRLLEGVSHLAIVVAAPPIMAAVATDRDRPVAMSIWAMFFGLSFAISAVLFPRILAIGGLPLLFTLHGGGLLVLAAILRPRLPQGERRAVPLAPLRLHLETYSTLPVALPGVGFVFYTITFVALLTFLPQALGRPALALSLPLISLAATLGAGLLCRRISPDRVALLGFVMGLGATLGMGFGWAWMPELAFVALGLVPGASFAAIPWFNHTDATRARATGAIAQMGNLGTTTGTPIFAALLATGGLPAILWGLGLFCLGGGLVLGVLGRKSRGG